MSLSNRKSFHPYWGKIKKLISIVVSQSLQMRPLQIHSEFGLPGDIWTAPSALFVRLFNTLLSFVFKWFWQLPTTEQHALASFLAKGFNDLKISLYSLWF